MERPAGVCSSESLGSRDRGALQHLQLVNQSAWTYRIECRAEVDKRHRDECVGAFWVVGEGAMGDGDGIDCGPFGPVGELGFNVLHATGR